MTLNRTHPPLDSALGLYLAIAAVRPSIGSDSFSLIQRDMARREYVRADFDDEFARQFDRVFPREGRAQ